MHMAKNYLVDMGVMERRLRVPLILGIWGPKGCGKTFQLVGGRAWGGGEGGGSRGGAGACRGLRCPFGRCTGGGQLGGRARESGEASCGVLTKAPARLAASAGAGVQKAR